MPACWLLMLAFNSSGGVVQDPRALQKFLPSSKIRVCKLEVEHPDPDSTVGHRINCLSSSSPSCSPPSPSSAPTKSSPIVVTRTPPPPPPHIRHMPRTKCCHRRHVVQLQSASCSTCPKEGTFQPCKVRHRWQRLPKEAGFPSTRSIGRQMNCWANLFNAPPLKLCFPKPL